MDRDWNAEKLALVEKRRAAVDRIAELGAQGSTPDADEALLAWSSAKLARDLVAREIAVFGH